MSVMKNSLILFYITLLFISCSQKRTINSKEEALKLIQNTEWEEINDLRDIGLGMVSTYLYFDDKGICYLYSTKPGGYKDGGKIDGKFNYVVDFQKEEKGNSVQICINGCDNPNVSFLIDEDNMNFIQLGENIVTSEVKRIKN